MHGRSVSGRWGFCFSPSPEAGVPLRLALATTAPSRGGLKGARGSPESVWGTGTATSSEGGAWAISRAVGRVCLGLTRAEGVFQARCHRSGAVTRGPGITLSTPTPLGFSYLRPKHRGRGVFRAIGVKVAGLVGRLRRLA